MKTLLSLAALCILTGGCTHSSVGPSAAASPPAERDTIPTFGTAIGSSFQGANQATTDTTADRSNGPR